MSAYPALVDEGDSVAIRALETAGAQRAAMHAGTRRLLALTVASPVRAVQRDLGGAASLTLAGAPHGGAGALIDDAVVAALDALIASGGGPAWDEAGWVALRTHVAAGLVGDDGADRRGRGRDPRRGPRPAARARRAAPRRRAAAGAARRRRPARRARLPGLPAGDRRGAVAGRHALPARRGPPAGAAARRRRRPTATGCACCTSSRPSCAAAARRPRRPPSARARGRLDAAGAARLEVRAGLGRARAGLREAGTPRAGGQGVADFAASCPVSLLLALISPRLALRRNVSATFSAAPSTGRSAAPRLLPAALDDTRVRDHVGQRHAQGPASSGSSSPRLPRRCRRLRRHRARTRLTIAAAPAGLKDRLRRRVGRAAPRARRDAERGPRPRRGPRAPCSGPSRSRPRARRRCSPLLRRSLQP